MKDYQISMRYLALIGFISLLLSCGTQQNSSPEEFNALSTLVTSEENINIEVDAAIPMNTFASQQVINAVMRNTGDTANRIDLSGDGHMLMVSKDSVIADLPFFGERRQGGGYNNTSNNGIRFNAVPTDYEVIKDSKRNRYRIKFSARANTEVFDIDLTLYPGGNADFYVASPTRTRIQYQGDLIKKK